MTDQPITTITNVPGPQTNVAILPLALYIQWDHAFIMQLLANFEATNDSATLLAQYKQYQEQKKDVRFG